ncbi:glycosyl hydrolase [Cadophora sp. MPI-SDFR-AT-0126]|nr:glycosyl hydrolase [Leotiomycetes sp. MPI-SDFR-AT-0126]
MDFTNPIIPGFAPDPSVIYIDDIFYLVNSSFHLFPGIPIYASRNLQDWTDRSSLGHAINRPEQLTLHNGSTASVPLHTGGNMIASGGLFAPTIRHHRGTFYIVCTNASFVPALKVHNFLISTTDIWASSWSDPIPIPYPGIDPSLFFDEDRAYIQGSFSISRETQPSCTIKQFRIDIRTGEQLTEAREIWKGHSCIDTEGPHMYKVGKWYYLLVAEGGTFENHMLSIARSRDIWGPYESFEGNPILTADGKPSEYIQNAGHGELLKDGAGQWWAVVLAVRNETTCQPMGRETFLTPVDWPKDGWPQIRHPQAHFAAPSPLLESNDDLKGAYDERLQQLSPRMEDVYIRDPDPSCYQMPRFDNPHSFILSPSLGDLLRPVGTSTFIGRRQRSLKAVTFADINLTTLLGDHSYNVTAGLAVYKDHLRHIKLFFDTKTRSVVFHGVNNSTGLDQASPKSFHIDEKTELIHLKIVSSPTEYCGYAAIKTDQERGEWTSLGSWQTRDFAAREMTGPIFGIFAHAASEEDQKVEVVFPVFTVQHCQIESK